MNETPDEYVKRRIALNRNMLVPYYLMLSQLYYVRDESLVSDGLYDHICKRLLAEWDLVEHWHKHLVDREGLSAGTGYHLKYPPRVVAAANALFAQWPPI